jgi:tetrahydromethanopterin S-methyltransferase subunit D
MIASLTIVIGLAAGLHAALYGAYKDSPHESFLMRRFMRELVFATGVSATLVSLHLSDGQSLFVIYLSVFALARIITEFWKLFLRVEPQEEYRIPTQIHWVKGVVHNPAIRLLLGGGFLAGIYGCYRLFRLLPNSLPWVLVGAIVGAGIGLAEAIAGAYKDGTIEGFSFRKFLKSPTFGALGGLVASFHTMSLAFLLLAAIGSMRMYNELLFKILVQDYTPGKFRSLTGPFQEWMIRRHYFLLPYGATWMLYFVLFVRP